MRYSDIFNYPRTWNRMKYPAVAHIEIEGTRLRQFEGMIEDQTQTRMLGHDLIGNGWVIVHVGCISDDVRHHLESAWPDCSSN